MIMTEDTSPRRWPASTVKTVCHLLMNFLELAGYASTFEAQLLMLVDNKLVRATPEPGAVEILDALAGGAPIAVATNSTRSMLSLVLRIRLHGYFAPSVAVTTFVTRPPTRRLPRRLHRVRCTADYRCRVRGLGPRLGGGGPFVVTAPSLPGSGIDSDRSLEWLSQ